jgi:ubiquinone/menaquinone biosynthesis C-methylase UbiE
MTDKEQKISGSTDEFDRNWRERQEAAYNHWTAGNPVNQVQLAFRSHSEVFTELIGPLARRRGQALEVGCGRGSLSSYFAADGWDVTLLDYSQTVIDTARRAFATNGHQAEFVTGDANDLPFPDNSFDVTYSIGLLEHFEDVRQPIAESLRVLRPGGWFLGYIVPERPDNLQRYFNWINRILKLVAQVFRVTHNTKPPKAVIYRSDLDSRRYIEAVAGLEYENLTVFGMYSLPMLSHSPEFPFSLLPKPVEWVLTQIFRSVLWMRKVITGRHGWICSEQMGQAFLLAFRKPAEHK